MAEMKSVYRDGSMKEEVVTRPESYRIYYRNFFPDPGCGENIQNGNYTWERDDISLRKLVELKQARGYIKEQIDLVIQEGPCRAIDKYDADSDRPGLSIPAGARDKLHEIWYYYGVMSKKDLMLIDYFADKQREYDDEYVNVHVVMINNHVIKATVSHIATGDFPYDIMVWQRREGLPWGIGVARQIRPAQRMVLGASRHMMDNAGVAGGPMIFFNSGVVEPASGPYEVKPWKMYMNGEDFDPAIHKLSDAIQVVTIPMLQGELEAIIQLGLKMAEDITGLPMIMQGQVNKRTPTTLGGMEMQNNNASTVLRRIARNYDDLVTENHIRRYYDYILKHVDDDSMKGDLMIDARGSSALVERESQNQQVIQLANYVANPIFGVDPKKWMTEYLKATKLDAKRFEYDDEKWQEIVTNMMNGPEDPRLAVAQFKAEHDERMKQFTTQYESGEKEKDRNLQIALAEMEREFDVYLQEMKEEGDTSRTADKLKTQISKTIMELKSQFALSGSSDMAPQVANPVVEPAGRAPEGQAFQK